MEKKFLLQEKKFSRQEKKIFCHYINKILLGSLEISSG